MSGIKWLIAASAASLLSGCGSLLPSEQAEVLSPFNDYLDAEIRYAQAQPGKTTRSELFSLGFDPLTQGNGKMLSFIDLRLMFVQPNVPIAYLPDGLVQCLAMVPGTSRSGATIIGGMLLGLSRKAATDYSFFLAIPTLIGAGVYSLYKERELLQVADLPMFAVGLFFSFVSAWLCVRWLLRYISTHSFVPFAWYRIAFGLLVLVTAWTGWIPWSA